MDITIILPIHQEPNTEFLDKALDSVKKNIENYTQGKLLLMIVCPSNVEKYVKNIMSKYNEIEYDIVINKGETDFCSQVNLAASKVNTEYFSILEFDDEYAPNWFSMMYDYYFSREDVSVFLPINMQHNEERSFWQFCNELVWANAFSNELGYIDFESLENCSTFNLTGGIFKTSDFIQIGMLKPSIKLAFNYEFLLRLTNKKLKVFVVPKEGYYHTINRKGSLTDEYIRTLDTEEISRWFNVSKKEYKYIEDRGVVNE